jgi:putative oxidoreductase
MLLVRVMVGLVFLTEGILKFLLPGELGAGRFAHLGFPYPAFLGPFVGLVEIFSGAAVIFGFFAGDAAVLLLIVILTALVTTKLPILIGHRLGRFDIPHLGHYGIFSFLHEARTDLCMVFGCLAVILDRGTRVVGRRR